MTGNLAGALERRGIPHHPEKQVADVEGVIENVDGHHLIATIRVKYTVKIPKGKRAEAGRAAAVHESRCPASQGVRRGIKPAAPRPRSPGPGAGRPASPNCSHSQA